MAMIIRGNKTPSMAIINMHVGVLMDEAIHHYTTVTDEERAFMLAYNKAHPNVMKRIDTYNPLHSGASYAYVVRILIQLLDTEETCQI
jgi:hypothetical protein